MATNRPVESETGVELLSRLASQEEIENLEPDILGKTTPGDVIEIVGDSNSGKTELLYHLCAKSIFPVSWKGINLHGLDITILYIDTDHKFSILRLMTILENRLSIAKSKANVIANDDETLKFLKLCLSRVSVINCKSTDDLIETFHSLDEILNTQEKPSKLILIDSISAFYWMDKMASIEQPKKFYDYYAKLVKIIQQCLNTYKLVLVATKQTLISSNTTSENAEYDFMGRNWEKLVTKQLKISSTIHDNETEHEIQIVKDNDIIKIKGIICDSGFNKAV